MHPVFPVMLGGALGAAARYLAGSALASRGGDWPLGTLVVNMLGGFLMGLLTAIVLKGQTSETIRLFVGVGLLGGFTTFSAFSLESFQLLVRGQWALGIGYVLASVIGSIAALALGYAVARI